MDFAFGVNVYGVGIDLWSTRGLRCYDPSYAIYSSILTERQKTAKEIEDEKIAEERLRTQQEKLQAALSNLLKDEANKDCDKKLGKFRFDNKKVSLQFAVICIFIRKAQEVPQ